jgi:hypothetical protein
MWYQHPKKKPRGARRRDDQSHASFRSRHSGGTAKTSDHVGCDHARHQCRNRGHSQAIYCELKRRPTAHKQRPRRSRIDGTATGTGAQGAFKVRPGAHGSAADVPDPFHAVSGKAQIELPHVAEDIVALGYHTALDPRHQVGKGAFAYLAVQAAVCGPAHGALHEEVPATRGFHPSAVVLLESKGRAEVSGLVSVNNGALISPVNSANTGLVWRERAPGGGAMRCTSRLIFAASKPNTGSMA